MSLLKPQTLLACFHSAGLATEHFHSTCEYFSPVRLGFPAPASHTVFIHLRMSFQLPCQHLSRIFSPFRHTIFQTYVSPSGDYFMCVFIHQTFLNACPVTAQTGKPGNQRQVRVRTGGREGGEEGEVVLQDIDSCLHLTVSAIKF